MDFEQNMFSQDYNYSQDYSMGHDSSHGSAHDSAHVRAKKDDPKEPPKDWTVAEEITLCQAWCDVLENNIVGNSMKTKGFWDAVITYFENETGSSRGYDSIVCKWKNRVRPRIAAFCAIIHNVKENHESSANDLDVYHKACAEYKMIYKQDFMLEHCYNVLKDHQGWLDVEMPSFYNTQGRKKSKTSETTSGSASGGFNLNDEADEPVEETQEVRPMGRDRSKAKKKSTGSSRGDLLHLLIW
ncbi:retrotransposon protein, putative, ty3-gypsy subclass [Tanacetum coccineum]|uniref:Retrotransposon protein, putative, ty3-gypsy subclass n=1 Tax=Tanacetum coccineum TaxID=301880 RepID=A0ABQ4Y6V8_9ASTR